MIPYSEAQEQMASGESAAGIIAAALQAGGPDAAVQKYRELRAATPGRYEFSESAFNTLGYRLIRQGRFAEAVRIFEMNVEQFPRSANVYDSLSEGYLYLGDRNKAEQVLAKALQTENSESSFQEQLAGVLQRIDLTDWQIRSETRAVARFSPGEPTGHRGPYLGQKTPGEAPEVFAPGIVSVLGYNDFCASFSPDGTELYFNRGMTIMVCRQEPSGWTAPEPADFSRGFRSHLAHLAFDNQRLFFGSSRPPQPYGIWLTERIPAGWSEPQRLWNGMHASSAMNGHIYFGIEGPAGGSIVRTRFIDGRYTEPEAQAMGFRETGAGRHGVFHPAVAPDESYLVFDDNESLYVSFRQPDGSWDGAISLGGILNDRVTTIPSVSPDGRFLFYTSHGDLHWVSTRVLEPLRSSPTSAGASAAAPDIFDAIRRGDAATVRALVEQDPSRVMAHNVRGSTPLHVAADADSAAAARFLLARGADPDASNSSGRTPLFYAKSSEMAGLLLDHGAEVNVRADDFTPLIHNIWRADRALADFLLSRGAEIPAPATPIGRLTAIRAFRIGNRRYFEEGLRQGLDPQAQSEGGNLWLHFAAESPSAELVDQLIGLGVPIDRRNAFGLTPLHIAASRGNTAVVKSLVEHGADPGLRTNDGNSAYNLAVKEGRAETAELLKSLGADLSPAHFPRLTGDYLEQPRPGSKAVLFAPGIVSGHHTYHNSIVATPDGDELFWSVGGGRDTTIYRMRRAEGRWLEPEVFSPGDAPFVSPDGRKLFFVGCTREDGADREIIFVRDRTPGGWAVPRALPATINALPGIHWGISEDRAGTFYFSAGERIRASEYRNGAYGEPALLDVLKDKNAYSPFVAPDGSFLLGNIEDAGDRMFILFLKPDGAWTEPTDLAGVIGVEHGFCPVVTPDGRHMFFVAMVDGLYAPYWMDASFIEHLRRDVMERLQGHTSTKQAAESATP